MRWFIITYREQDLLREVVVIIRSCTRHISVHDYEKNEIALYGIVFRVMEKASEQTIILVLVDPTYDYGVCGGEDKCPSCHGTGKQC